MTLLENKRLKKEIKQIRSQQRSKLEELHEFKEALASTEDLKQRMAKAHRKEVRTLKEKIKSDKAVYD